MKVNSLHSGFLLWSILLAWMCTPAYTQSSAQTRVAEILKELKQHPLYANSEQTAKSVALLKELGDLGSKAAGAVPFLVSEDFFLIKGGYTAKDRPLRLATIDALVQIGESAVPAVLNMLKMPQGRNKFQWKDWGKVILTRMAQTETVEVILPALEKEMHVAKQKHEYYSLLASLGPKSVPLLQKEAQALAGKKNVDRATANDIRRLGNLLGSEIGSAIDAVIPERYTEKTWDDQRYWIHYRGGWQPLAHARPNPKHIQAFLDLLRNESLNGTRYYEGVRQVGMILCTMEAEAVLPLAELLKDANLETRWAAAFILEMLGPEAKSALPALGKTFEDDREAIEVRVQAAKAIAMIKGTHAAELYQKIPNLHKLLTTASRERSLYSQSQEAWQTLLKSEPDKVHARQLALYNRTPEAQRPIYNLAANKDLQTANQWVRKYAKGHLSGKTESKSFGDGKMSEDLNLFVYLFGKGSQHYPGRLETDVEQTAKEYMFRSVDILPSEHKGKPRYIPKSSSDLKKILALDASICVAEFTNGPLRSDAQHYLILQSLVSDPKFKSRKFRTGDTVAQRYDLFTKFFQRGLKEWALHGMWVELGSSNYEQKTYRGLLLLLDFAKDSVLAARSRMLMDLAMIEITQISISGLRAGSKSRAKDGGLDGRFNHYLAMLFGEHHGYLLEPPGFKGYRPPEPAILLRRLGPTEKTYGILNRHPGETIQVPQPMTQGNHFHKAKSRSFNYAYCTPEYITGCSMFDVRHWPEVEKTRKNRKGEIQTYKTREFGYAPLGRWSGVVFRDASAIYLEAYTGEKWNAQTGDVMIAQRYPKSYYQGEARVNFAGSLELVEKEGWIFVDNKDAYAAVRIVKGGYLWNEPARLQLHLQDQYSPILIQTGRQKVYQSFANFQQAILSAPLQFTDEKLDYQGPHSQRLEFFLCQNSEKNPYPKTLPKFDGRELDFNMDYNYRSPYLENKVGSEVVTVRYGERSWEYDFGKNTVTEVK